MTTLLYFASIREKVGHGHEEVNIPAHIATVSDLLAWLQAKDERHGEAFCDLATLRIAVDQEHATLDTTIINAGEIAFFPPVTGG